MERRAFISTSVVAALAAITKPSILYARPSSHPSLLENFIGQFNFKPTTSYESDPLFTLLHQKTSQCLQRVGYQSSKKGIYSLPPSNLVLVPWELNTADLGCLDTCFLFFEKLPDNQWQYLKTLNQYEINTILQVVSSISPQYNTNNYLADSLLPHYSKAHWPHGYSTQQGHVEMIVKVDNEGVQSKVWVWNKSELICQKNCNLSVHSPSQLMV